MFRNLAQQVQQMTSGRHTSLFIFVQMDTRKRLRSSSTSALVTPSSCRTTIGDRALFVAAPRVWNTLPSSVTASETLGTFKRRLKTHLFATSFPYFFLNCAHRILFCILTLKRVLKVIFRLLNDTLIIFV